LVLEKDRTNLQESGVPGWINWAFFYGSVLFFMANLFAAIAIFPAYSISIGSSPFQAGLQNTIFAIASVFFRFYLGPAMDQRGSKPLMLIGAFTFATAPLIIMFSSSYNVLVVARIYQSIGLAVFLPGMSTLVAEMAPPLKIGTYLGSLRIFINIGLLTGPSAALFIIEGFSYRSWFMTSALIGLAAVVLLAAVKAPAVQIRVQKKAGSWAQIMDALGEKKIVPLIAGIAIFSFTYSAVISFAAVHIETAAPGSEAAYFFIVFGAAGIAASLSAGALSDRFGRQRVAWPMLFTLGAGAVLFSFLPAWPALIMISAVILGIGIQGSSLVIAAWLIDLSKPKLRATTISIQENTIDITFAIGALAFGLSAQGPGLGFAFLAAGIITIAAILPLKRKVNAMNG
jgi:predicted MFS family arabinose efflux permease